MIASRNGKAPQILINSLRHTMAMAPIAAVFPRAGGFSLDAIGVSERPLFVEPRALYAQTGSELLDRLASLDLDSAKRELLLGKMGYLCIGLTKYMRSERATAQFAVYSAALYRGGRIVDERYDISLQRSLLDPDTPGQQLLTVHQNAQLNGSELTTMVPFVEIADRSSTNAAPIQAQFAPSSVPLDQPLAPDYIYMLTMRALQAGDLMTSV